MSKAIADLGIADRGEAYLSRRRRLLIDFLNFDFKKAPPVVEGIRPDSHGPIILALCLVIGATRFRFGVPLLDRTLLKEMGRELGVDWLLELRCVQLRLRAALTAILTPEPLQPYFDIGAIGFRLIQRPTQRDWDDWRLLQETAIGAVRRDIEEARSFCSILGLKSKLVGPLFRSWRSPATTWVKWAVYCGQFTEDLRWRKKLGYCLLCYNFYEREHGGQKWCKYKACRNKHNSASVIRSRRLKKDRTQQTGLAKLKTIIDEVRRAKVEDFCGLMDIPAAKQVTQLLSDARCQEILDLQKPEEIWAKLLPGEKKRLVTSRVV